MNLRALSWTLLTLLFSLGLAPPAPAQDSKLESLHRQAEHNDANAQAELGYHYHTGQTVRQDYEQAVSWYRKAADQGQAKAQYHLGVAYAFGEGVEHNPAKAAEWYRRAAEQGHAQAAFSLGLAYLYGDGVTPDSKLAARWLQQSAEADYNRAQVRLANLYYAGNGVPQDNAQAAHWYRQAAERGDAYAQFQLGNLYRDGLGVPRDPDQALAWYRAAAQQNHPAATAELIALEPESDTETGTSQNADAESATTAVADATDAQVTGFADMEAGRQQDDAQTDATAEETGDLFSWLLGGSSQGADSNQAETAGDTETTVRTARVPTNEEWVEPVAEDEQSDSIMDKLAALFMSEESTTDPAVEEANRALESGNHLRALQLLETAALDGNAAAETELGNLYFQGQKLPRDRDRALLWYRRAAKRNYAPAQFQLGNMYLDGAGVLQDDAMALAWFTRAAEQDHEAASEALKSLEQQIAEKQRYQSRTPKTDETIDADNELESAVEATDEAVETDPVLPGHIVTPPVESPPASNAQESGDETAPDTSERDTDPDTVPVRRIITPPIDS